MTQVGFPAQDHPAFAAFSPVRVMQRGSCLAHPRREPCRSCTPTRPISTRPASQRRRTVGETRPCARCAPWACPVPVRARSRPVFRTRAVAGGARTRRRTGAHTAPRPHPLAGRGRCRHHHPDRSGRAHTGTSRLATVVSWHRAPRPHPLVGGRSKCHVVVARSSMAQPLLRWPASVVAAVARGAAMVVRTDGDRPGIGRPRGAAVARLAGARVAAGCAPDAVAASRAPRS